MYRAHEAMRQVDMYMNYMDIRNNGVVYTTNFKNHYIPARMHNQRNNG